MNHPVFSHEWPAHKMIKVAQALVTYWANKEAGAKAKLERMGPGDDNHLSPRKKIERERDTAAQKRYECDLFAKDVVDCARDGRMVWLVHTNDLPWFFPEGAPETD